MNLADCYRLLGLRTGASYDEIKASYRRLARQYHPDVNPDNQQQAKEKFIQLSEAYRILMEAVQPKQTSDEKGSKAKPKSTPSAASSSTSSKTRSPSPSTAKSAASKSPAQVKITRKAPPIERNPEISQTDYDLKQNSYEQLQRLLRAQRYPRAIALVEGLAQRLPNDTEVRQWQAITYQRFGRHLVDAKQSEKARIYLKKALRTDPHNKALWYEVERDFRRIEQIEIY
ncbi:J domain-containing protein [Oscillatoria sp. FACHB-1407]|uniref:J domain-containing protein n=1 Tax=Oscillatoria sp. FACHB-1407 TaxID=2692847 RepID=UPI00168812D5|nr:J domain-containing protein [Oscillatoria sp. FACHB-1407]MBD2460125.1 J domain-containing protein [Oscillatoria sp. FACHB-1407]